MRESGTKNDTAALVRRSQTGDLDAFGVLVNSHEAHVRELVALVLGTSSGETIVTETAAEIFAAAWDDLLRLRAPDEFSQWLLRRAVRTAARRIPAGAGTGADALPPRERAAVRLHCARIEDAEAAALLGCSVAEYWARLYDGCRHLHAREQANDG